MRRRWLESQKLWEKHFRLQIVYTLTSTHIIIMTYFIGNSLMHTELLNCVYMDNMIHNIRSYVYTKLRRKQNPLFLLIQIRILITE